MAGDLLLDTNIVVALFKREPAVMNRIAAATEVFVTVITVGKLYFGALKSSRQAETSNEWRHSSTVLLLLELESRAGWVSLT